MLGIQFRRFQWEAGGLLSGLNPLLYRRAQRPFLPGYLAIPIRKAKGCFGPDDMILPPFREATRIFLPC
jgi:hypothetical protein